MDVETDAKEVCDDGIDNNCDGYTDPEDCIDPCEDLDGHCNRCISQTDCWFGFNCEKINWGDSSAYCLKYCLNNTQCPEGFSCVKDYSLYLCIPDDNSCEGDAWEYPDESCDTGTDADTDTDTDTDEDAGVDSGTQADSGVEEDDGGDSDSCGCSQPGLWSGFSLIELLFRLST